MTGSVIFFSPEYPPHVSGGLGTHVDQITAALGRAIDVDLFVPERGGYQAPPARVRLHEVPVAGTLEDPRGLRDFGELAAREAARKTQQPLLIHAHDWMTAFAGIRAREILRKPLVFNVHLPQPVGRGLLAENLGLCAADLVLVNSTSVRDELESRCPGMRRIEVLANGVNSLVFSPAEDWPRDDGYLLFVGRLVPQKGVDTLLLALSVLLRRCPEMRLVIAGDGFFDLFLRRLSRHLGLPDRVDFVGWRTGPPLVKLYQRAQVVVVPSHYEPFGIVALEAMACARPVVASRVGGLGEILEHGVQGFLFTDGDYLDLARRLASLALDPELRLRMGRAARRRAMEFSWDLIARRLIALYREIEVEGSVAADAPASELRSRLLESCDEGVRTAAAELLSQKEGT
jgi:glycosyltransferase involved in cell wall biosynthesis